MYRVLIFMLLNVAVSLGCQAPPCHWQDKDLDRAINLYEEVVKKVINADVKTQELCNRQGSTVLEVHTKQEYKLIVPGAGSESYEIKVRDRVVQIVPDECQNSLTEVKILPSYVNGYGGRYYSYEGNLEVAFPYKYNPQDGGGSCQEPNENAVSLHPGICIDCV